MPDPMMTFFQNSYGFRLTFNTGTNLSTTSHIELKIVRPKPLEPIVRTLTTADMIDRAGGKVAYVVQEGDLALPGTYTVQLTDITPGRRIPSIARRFKVSRTL